MVPIVGFILASFAVAASSDTFGVGENGAELYDTCRRMVTDYLNNTFSADAQECCQQIEDTYLSIKKAGGGSSTGGVEGDGGTVIIINHLSKILHNNNKDSLMNPSYRTLGGIYESLIDIKIIALACEDPVNKAPLIGITVSILREYCTSKNSFLDPSYRTQEEIDMSLIDSKIIALACEDPVKKAPLLGIEVYALTTYCMNKRTKDKSNDLDLSAIEEKCNRLKLPTRIRERSLDDQEKSKLKTCDLEGYLQNIFQHLWRAFLGIKNEILSLADECPKCGKMY